MNNTMLNIAIRQLRVLPLCGGEPLAREQVLAILSELGALGYRVSNPARLAHAGIDTLALHRQSMQVLAAMRGADKAWVPLFSGFPDDVPDEHAYFGRRIVGFLGAALGLFEDGEVLPTGAVIPEWLFDLRAFGADPVTQMQTRALFEQGVAQQADRAGDTHVEWIDLSLVTVDEAEVGLRKWLQAALYARSPLSEGVRADIAALLAELGPEVVDPAQIAVKETLAFVLGVYWRAAESDRLASLVRSPTDLLRLFALLTEGDVSLGAKIKWPRFTRSQRRMALGALEGCPRILEDLGRYRRLWLAIGRGLHVGEYTARFPKTAAAFARLRSGPVPSFASVTEARMASGDVDGLLAHLRTRPGVLVRRFHEVLRRFPDHTEAIIAVFAAVAAQAPVRSLLVLDAHLRTINSRDARTIINKRGRIKVLDNPTKGALSAETLSAACAAVEAALLAALSDRDAWGEQSVYIEPALSAVTVPLQQRSASDGLIPLGRGSRVPVDLGRVLRLFVYWKQASMRTDLDLSVVQFDKDFNYLGHVSYTQLAADGIVHSGDIQSAPEGASEFIDITLSKLPEKVRYLAPQIYRYSGEGFDALAESFAGWMIREQATKDRKAFDPKTVANGYALRGTGAYAFPLLVDRQQGEVVLIDLCVGKRVQHSRVENSHDSVGQIAQQLAAFTQTRPTMARLAALHAQARGATPAEAPDTADIRFGVSEGTYSASNPTQILAELL